MIPEQFLPAIERRLASLEAVQERLGTIESRLQNIEITVTRLEERMTPVRLITYGLVGLVFTGTIGALLSLVFSRRNG